VRMTGRKNPEMLDILGAAYAQAGRFSEAVNTAKDAKVLAEEMAMQELVATLGERIELYKQGRPAVP
jgi:hypothetical protein